MAKLYPSWIEVPITNLERAMAFYRVVGEENPE
jgi:predicted enzyme related to lactoylglutathione lyase